MLVNFFFFQVSKPSDKVSYLIFLLGSKLNKGSVNIIQRRCRKTRGRSFRLIRLWRRTRSLLRSCPRRRPRTTSRGCPRCGQRIATVHVRQWGLHRRRMRIDPVGHDGPVWRGKRSSWTWAGSCRGSGRPIGSRGVSIRSRDAIRSCWCRLRLRLGRTGMTS